MWRQETQAYIIDRAVFDEAMASRAQDSGAEYILGSLVENIEVRDDRVRVEAAHRGERLNYEAQISLT